MSLFNVNDAVCVGCLSSNRKLSMLQNPTLFYYLLGRPTVGKALADSVPACWECAALLRRIKQFQIQVKNAGIILEKCMERSVKGSFSKLGIHQNNDYDFIIEETVPPDDEIKIDDIKNVNIKIEKLDDCHLKPDNKNTNPHRSSKRLKEKQIETIVIANPHIVEVRTKEETVVSGGLLNLALRETYEDSREFEEVEKTEVIIEDFEELNEKLDEQNDAYNEAYDFDDDSHLEACNIGFKSDQITKPVRSSNRLKEKQIETIVIANPYIVEVRTKEETEIADGLLNLAQRETYEDSREFGDIEEFEELNEKLDEQNDGYNEAYDFDDDSHLEADNIGFKVEKTEGIIEEFEELNGKIDNNGEIETNNRNRSHNGQFISKGLDARSPKKKQERWANIRLKKILIEHPETLTYFTEAEPHENLKKEFFGNENPDPDKPWRCLPCMVAFQTKRRLYTHHILKHDLERSKRTWFYFKPKHPLRTKANLAVFRCTLCRELVQRISLQAHVEQFHKFRLYCEDCDWSFWSNEDFKSHLRALHRHAVCDLCAFTGNTKNRLETHMRKFHLSATCHDCSRVFRPPDAHSRLRDHRWLSHPRAGDAPERRYCVECDRRFPTSNAYEHHLKVHKAHIMQRVSYPCHACGKVFSSRTAAARACAEHAGSLRRPCPHCPDRFPNASRLKRHVERVHLKLRLPKGKGAPRAAGALP